MRLRTIQLASVVLLLASFGVAEGAAPRAGGYSVGGHYIATLLAYDNAVAGTLPELTPGDRDAFVLALPTAALAQTRLTWTMRPPSSHSAQTHAVTASRA